MAMTVELITLRKDCAERREVTRRTLSVSFADPGA